MLIGWVVAWAFRWPTAEVKVTKIAAQDHYLVYALLLLLFARLCNYTANCWTAARRLFGNAVARSAEKINYILCELPLINVEWDSWIPSTLTALLNTLLLLWTISFWDLCAIRFIHSFIHSCLLYSFLNVHMHIYTAPATFYIFLYLIFIFYFIFILFLYKRTGSCTQILLYAIQWQ